VSVADVLRAEGELALSQGNSKKSVETLRRARTSYPHFPTELSLAWALIRTGSKGEAIELLEAIVSKLPGAWEGQVARVLAHRDLARLYEESGETDKARKTYSRMLELWRNADPDLRPVKEVRSALSRLAGAPAPKASLTPNS
jgi:tetratricopeptide (TPR) repeat protein